MLSVQVRFSIVMRHGLKNPAQPPLKTRLNFAMCAFSIYTSGPSVYKPAMISLSLGSRLTVQGRNISTSRAARTGILEERKTSKLRTSPSISSNGSTSLVVGMFLDILHIAKKKDRGTVFSRGKRDKRLVFSFKIGK